MVILKLKADNFFIFKDFEMDFTYPKKIVRSQIENEHLVGFPNFRYKKFVLVMGSNASGKTVLGKLLLGIFNFIAKREYSSITSFIENPNLPASFEIDMVIGTNTLYRISTAISAKEGEQYDSSNVSVKVRSCTIDKNDSYESCVLKLEKNECAASENYIKELEKVASISWMFKFTGSNDETIDSKSIPDSQNYFNILERILKIMDPRIVDVEAGPDFPDSFFIHYEHRIVPVFKGNAPTDNTLSSGTRESISIAHLLSSIKCRGYGFFYCDEKFSHIHSDAEAAFLSLMISCLGDNEQLIVTTHNQDIASLSFPKHSFVFLRRERTDSRVSCIYASELLKRNTDSLKAAIDNDLFGASPSVDAIYRLKEI